MENAPPENILEILKVAGTVIVAAIAAFGTWLVAVTPKFGTKKQSQIDQLQEDVKELRGYTKELKSDVAKLNNTVNKQRQVMITRDFAWRQRNWELEQWILEGKPLPFPVLSEILSTFITIEE